MILLDTDTLSLLFKGHPRVQRRMHSSEENIAIPIITWIEILRGRFESILKAADGDQLRQAQQRLRDSEQMLATIPIISISVSAAEEFEKLLRIKKLKKLGRGDLLIASIALACKAVLITRNRRDFNKIPDLIVEDWAN